VLIHIRRGVLGLYLEDLAALKTFYERGVDCTEELCEFLVEPFLVIGLRWLMLNYFLFNRLVHFVLKRHELSFSRCCVVGHSLYFSLGLLHSR
jgi:hypothetical protein